MPGRCLVCDAGEVDLVLDLGLQAVSSHFTSTSGAPTLKRPLAVGVCLACGTVQLTEPFPFRDLTPPYDWITYREPERHLDEVVADLFARGLVAEGATVAGLSFKDDTTLARFAERGLATWRLDVQRDLGTSEPRANIETVAGLLRPGLARTIVSERGAADVVVARHVLEHADEPASLLAALDELLRPGGMAVVEVPDCRANLQRCDYAMLWEEHTVYFTPDTFALALRRSGFEVLTLGVHVFPFEDVMVAVVRKPETSDHASMLLGDPAGSIAQARRFGAEFPRVTDQLRSRLSELCGGGGRLAAYGAGHLTSAVLQYHGVAEFFAFVVDDTVEKQGLFMPDSGLPILPREALVTRDPVACAFGLSPDVEDRVIAKNREYPGPFYSLLVDSPRSLRRFGDPGSVVASGSAGS